MMVGSITSLGSSEHVMDELDLLSNSEIDALESSILKLRENYSMDIVIVMTDQLNGQSSEAFADDYFDYNQYGINGEGILLLLNMLDREVWISTSGNTTIELYQPYIDSMLDNVIDYLLIEDYFSAANAFLSDLTDARIGKLDQSLNSSNISKDGIVQGSHYDDQHSSSSQRLITSPFYIIGAILISLLAGGIPTGIITHHTKGKTTTTHRTYESKNSFTLNSATDQFLNETITRRTIQQSNSGGTHRGSSGRSHGGGGKKF
jgi:uncharacterized protein